LKSGSFKQDHRRSLIFLRSFNQLPKYKSNFTWFDRLKRDVEQMIQQAIIVIFDEVQGIDDLQVIKDIQATEEIAI